MRGPHPLTIYWYGADNDRYDRLQRATRSGSVNANDFTVNFIGSELPFGGVGRSGTGAYRGRAGFDTFTHARAVAFSRWPVSLGRMMAPPFGRVGTPAWWTCSWRRSGGGTAAAALCQPRPASSPGTPRSLGAGPAARRTR